MKRKEKATNFVFFWKWNCISIIVESFSWWNKTKKSEFNRKMTHRSKSKEKQVNISFVLHKHIFSLDFSNELQSLLKWFILKY